MAYAHIEIFETTDASRPNAQEVGQIALVWNSLNLIVFCMFLGLSGMDKHLAAKAFYSLKSDASQHDLTKEMAMHSLSRTEGDDALEVAEVVKNFFKDLKKFSRIRNAAVHGSRIILNNGEKNFWGYNPFDEPLPDQPRFKVFEKIKEHVSTAISLEIRGVEVFNQLSYFFQWTEDLLVFS